MKDELNRASRDIVIRYIASHETPSLALTLFCGEVDETAKRLDLSPEEVHESALYWLNYFSSTIR